MATKKLYYEDVNQKEFGAYVLSSSYDEKKKCWLIELDQTAFYPEGGGQPADQGVLVPAGGTQETREAVFCTASASESDPLPAPETAKPVQVLDVHEKEERILHYCDASLEPGTRVTGRIDWNRRFDHMQQHSGEHIVSGMICSRFHCDNVGFHLGKDLITIDYNAEITMTDLRILEEEANRYLWENHALVVMWPTAEELAALDYRSKKELSGAVRITSFPGADMCACCGTHVLWSGQVGLVKFLSCQKIAKGTRIELLCGKRALDFLSMNYRENQIIGVAMASSLEKTGSVYLKQKQELIDLKMKLSELESSLFEKTAEEYRGQGPVTLLREPMGADSLRKLTVTIGERCGGRCIVFAGEGEHFQYAVMDAEAPEETAAYVRELNAALHGRGGGRNGFAQGSVEASRREIRKYLGFM